MYNVTTAMKIGGIETYYWEISKELKNLGHEVEIICGYGDNIKYDDIKIEQFDFIQRKKIPNLGNRFRKWGERISFFINARKYLKSQKYDYFLIHKPFDFFACFFMKKYHKQLKTIFISGGEDFYGFDKFFSKYVDFMFSVSKDNSLKIKNRYKKLVHVVPNGVDINKFNSDTKNRDHFRSFYNLQNKQVLISVGRVVGWKGFQLILQALPKLNNFYYVLIGDGEYLQNLKDMVKKSKLEDSVLFLGSIDNKELPKYLNMADIFVQPSIGHEAFGITIIEAMACGLPVVASKNGGIVDIVIDDKVGYLFEIENISEMTIAIQKAYTNKNFLSQKCKEHVAQKYTWNSCIATLLNKIKEK